MCWAMIRGETATVRTEAEEILLQTPKFMSTCVISVTLQESRRRRRRFCQNVQSGTINSAARREGHSVDKLCGGTSQR